MRAAKIGIMQGRLCRPTKAGFRPFRRTVGARNLHAHARRASTASSGYTNNRTKSENPLATDEGVAEMRRQIAETGVQVRSICADYYMTRPLVSDTAGADPAVADHLRWLMGRARILDIAYIVLPFVDFLP